MERYQAKMKLMTFITLYLAFAGTAFADGIDIQGITYARIEGKELKGTLFVQKEHPAALRPAIVLIHGGAWLTGSRIQMRWYGKAFAERGYVALTIDYRTMPGYTFPAPVEDAKAAVRWLRQHANEYGIDTGKIAAMGTSSGGHLALMLAVTRPEDGLEGTENLGVPSDVTAAVSLYGPSDLRGFESESAEAPLGGAALWRPYLKSFLGEKSFGGRKPEEAASPIVYVDRNDPPLLLIHGEKDSLVPVKETERLFSRLEDAGANATMMKVEGYGHAFDHLHPRMRKILFEKILAFLSTSMGLA